MRYKAEPCNEVGRLSLATRWALSRGHRLFVTDLLSAGLRDGEGIGKVRQVFVVDIQFQLDGESSVA